MFKIPNTVIPQYRISPYGAGAAQKLFSPEGLAFQSLWRDGTDKTAGDNCEIMCCNCYESFAETIFTFHRL